MGGHGEGMFGGGGGGGRGAVKDNEGQWVVMVRVCLVGGGGVEGQ